MGSAVSREPPPKKTAPRRRSVRDPTSADAHGRVAALEAGASTRATLAGSRGDSANHGWVRPTGVLHIVYPSNTADSRGIPRLDSDPLIRLVSIASRLPLRRAATASATLLVLGLAVLAFAAPAPAASTSNCAKQVIADWFDNTRIDRIYPLHCYREAVKILPVDVRDYSSAREDILRALAYAQQGKEDPGDPGSGSSGGNGSGTGDGTGGSGGGTTTDPGGADGGPGEQPGSLDTSGPSAVPIPLIVLAGIAGLLLVLGAAGYFTRRAAERRADDPQA